VGEEIAHLQSYNKNIIDNFSISCGILVFLTPNLNF